MELEIKNDQLSIQFSIEYVDNMSKMFRDIDTVMDDLNLEESKRFSAASFKKCMRGESNSVKGWRFTIVNPLQTRINERERQVAKRQEERAERKAHKRALKAANKNLANGHRKRVNAQSTYQGRKSAPKFKPTAVALNVHHNITR